MKVYVDEFHKTVHYAGSYYGPEALSDPTLPQQVHREFVNCGFDLTRASKYKLLIDFGGEGHCDISASSLITYLQTLGFRDMLVVFKTKVDVSRLSYPAISLVESMANHQSWFDFIDQVTYNDHIDVKFLCLIRRPSPSRARIAATLKSVGSIRLSFGSNCFPEQLIEYQKYLPDTPLPILIDGYTMRDSNLPEHDQRDPLFHSSLFNLVVESGSQTDYNVWQSIFITEKSYKAFGLRQIPVWFAVPGLVAAVRGLGFDLFDDIIDHSYDSVLDEAQRYDQAIDQIRKLDQQYTLDQCQDLRRDLRPRFDRNYQLVKDLGINVQKRFREALEDFYAR